VLIIFETDPFLWKAITLEGKSETRGLQPGNFTQG